MKQKPQNNKEKILKEIEYPLNKDGSINWKAPQSKEKDWEEIAHIIWNAENEYHAKKILEDLGNRLLSQQKKDFIKDLENLNIGDFELYKLIDKYKK